MEWFVVVVSPGSAVKAGEGLAHTNRISVPTPERTACRPESDRRAVPLLTTSPLRNQRELSSFCRCTEYLRGFKSRSERGLPHFDLIATTLFKHTSMGVFSPKFKCSTLSLVSAGAAESSGYGTGRIDGRIDGRITAGDLVQIGY